MHAHVARRIKAGSLCQSVLACLVFMSVFSVCLSVLTCLVGRHVCTRVVVVTRRASRTRIVNLEPPKDADTAVPHLRIAPLAPEGLLCLLPLPRWRARRPASRASCTCMHAPRVHGRTARMHTTATGGPTLVPMPVHACMSPACMCVNNSALTGSPRRPGRHLPYAYARVAALHAWAQLHALAGQLCEYGQYCSMASTHTVDRS